MTEKQKEELRNIPHDYDMIPEMGVRPMTPEGSAETSRFIQEYKKNLSRDERILNNLISLNARIKDFISSDKPFNIYTLGTFLLEYLEATELKQTQLSEALGIHPTRINNLIHNRVKLTHEEAFKLQKHSNEFFPALLWIQVQQKNEREAMGKDKRTQREAYRKVKRTITLPKPMVFDSGSSIA